jgi:hypothetical protein
VDYRIYFNTALDFIDKTTHLRHLYNYCGGSLALTGNGNIETAQNCRGKTKDVIKILTSELSLILTRGVHVKELKI